MTVLKDPVKNLAKIADFDGSGYLEVWTSIRDGGADGILTDIEAARAELDESWQPLALAFARLVHQNASER